MKPVGILALQGNYAQHHVLLNSLHYRCQYVRGVAQLHQCRALIIPGGESTTILHLLRRTHLFAPLQQKIQQGFPVFGICAGAVLLANTITQSDLTPLGGMDITIKRNAYGRQIASHLSAINVTATLQKWLSGALPHPSEYSALFIRAPKILSWGSGVRPLAHCGEELVAAHEGNVLVATFHPEATATPLLHRYFCEVVARDDNGSWV